MRFLLVLLWGLGVGGQVTAQQATITITNPNSTSLVQSVVELPWSTVQKTYPQIDTAQLQVVLVTNGKEVAYQFEHKGQKAIQNLLVQVSLGPNESVRLRLRRGRSGLMTPKTYCCYVPERYDDFAWENDRVAFRIYGAALNGRSDNAYGSDIWSKRTPALILDKWYKQGDYHMDHGEGLDYYHVGQTLGGGDLGVYLNDSIQFIHNYRSWEILDNGPLRSTFRVKFDPYTFKGITVNETRTVSLDAGSQLSKIQVSLTHTAPEELPMVVGITLRQEESPLLMDEKEAVLGYWEPRHGEDGTIGVGCVFPAQYVSMFRKYEHGLAKLSAKSGQTLTYYAGGAWDKAGLITSSDNWFAYLRQYASQLKRPPVIKMNK